MILTIRSQDKATIVSVSKITLSPSGISIMGDNIPLGSYKTEDMAMRVLDSINKAIVDNRTVEMYAIFGDLTNCRNIAYIPVYQMPSEEE